eukprot:Nk52_evm68s1073 gene=Nk52_evmTU68s1073
MNALEELLQLEQENIQNETNEELQIQELECELESTRDCLQAGRLGLWAARQNLFNLSFEQAKKSYYKKASALACLQEKLQTLKADAGEIQREFLLLEKRYDNAQNSVFEIEAKRKHCVDSQDKVSTDIVSFIKEYQLFCAREKALQALTKHNNANTLEKYEKEILLAHEKCEELQATNAFLEDEMNTKSEELKQMKEKNGSLEKKTEKMKQKCFGEHGNERSLQLSIDLFEEIRKNRAASLSNFKQVYFSKT